MTTLRHYGGTGRDYHGKPYDAQLTPDDIREMQTIDADCNDCIRFRRGAMIKVPGLKLFDGHCLNLDRPTRAYPTQYTGRACFEHRRKPTSTNEHKEAA